MSSSDQIRDHADERLDELLIDTYDSIPLDGPTTARLKARILERVATPADPLSRIMRWLRQGPMLVRPAVLALVPLALGFALGISFPEAGAGDDVWMETADLLAFVSIEDYADDESLSNSQ